MRITEPLEYCCLFSQPLEKWPNFTLDTEELSLPSHLFSEQELQTARVGKIQPLNQRRSHAAEEPSARRY